jgi:cysteine desulfurase
VGSRSYLDSNATVLLLPEARHAIAELLEERLGNPSSVHHEGRTAGRLLEAARAEVAALLGATPDEVVFTSGGSEANAMALWGHAAAAGRLGEQAVVVSTVEHPSVHAAAAQLERLGVPVARIGVDPRGLVQLDDLRGLLAARPVAVLALQLANSETGVVQPLAEAAQIARERGVSVHCDAVQAAGRMPFTAAELGVDTLAVASHKLGGPGGAGAVVVRGGMALAPLIPGTQEGGRRGGTENLLGIVGMGAAARVARERIAAWAAVARLREAMEDELGARIPGSTIFGRQAPRLPNTTCVGLPAPLRGAVAVSALDLAGFAVSSGPACSSGAERGSAVVEAMGFTSDVAERTLRISLDAQTSPREVHDLVSALVEVVRRARGGGL